MAAGLDAEPARHVFSVAREVLGWDVRDACLHGPKARLDATETAQPALLATSVAAAAVLEARGLLPDLVAGHSVGEFAALVTARALSFEDALRVVEVRGRAMAARGRARPGRMAAVIGLPLNAVEDVCNATRDVVVANVNGPDQVVVSGARDAVAALAEPLRSAGARRVIPLSVVVAAHSPLMSGAGAELRAALEHAHVDAPAIPFVSSATGGFVAEPDAIADELASAVTGRVVWTDAVRALSDAGAERYVEVGPGRVLTSLVRRILPAADVATVGTDADAAAEARAAVDLEVTS